MVLTFKLFILFLRDEIVQYIHAFIFMLELVWDGCGAGVEGTTNVAMHKTLNIHCYIIVYIILG